MPSVTTVRITEHNGGSADIMPAQGKQQETVVVDSALMKLALRQTVTLLVSVATSACWPTTSHGDYHQKVELSLPGLADPATSGL